jgi:hypothetical protein
MNRYAEETEPILDPYKVINDPRWEEIRKAAGDLADTLQHG